MTSLKSWFWRWLRHWPQRRWPQRVRPEPRPAGQAGADHCRLRAWRTDRHLRAHAAAASGRGPRAAGDHREPGGAGGTLAESMLAKSAPDGYSMMVSADSPPAIRICSATSTTISSATCCLSRCSRVCRSRWSCILGACEFAGRVRGLRALAPGQFSYASPGTGTGNHLFMELFKAGRHRDDHVPYKAAARR